MTMEDERRVPFFERRWPVGLAILAVLALLTALPGRIILFPSWAPFVVTLILLGAMTAAGLTRGRPRWLLLERRITLLFVVFAGSAMLATLSFLVRAMVFRPGDISGLQLLASSVAVWATNVLVFSLLYWQIDRGGPEARVAHASPRPDWLFPQESAPAEDVPPGWRPAFGDYLFLGYTTATAFSPTDTLPLTFRAKMLMMLESAISLATILVVAARAINILGS
jgi:hypothetical protein